MKALVEFEHYPEIDYDVLWVWKQYKNDEDLYITFYGDIHAKCKILWIDKEAEDLKLAIEQDQDLKKWWNEKLG